MTEGIVKAFGHVVFEALLIERLGLIAVQALINRLLKLLNPLIEQLAFSDEVTRLLQVERSARIIRDQKEDTVFSTTYERQTTTIREASYSVGVESEQSDSLIPWRRLYIPIQLCLKLYLRRHICFPIQ
jgi:hypothetical protein